MIMYKRLALAIAILIALTTGLAAQTDTPAQGDSRDGQKARPRTTSSQKDPQKDPKSTGERLEPDDPSRAPSDVPPDVQANRQEQVSEEAEVTPVYNNFFTTYKLGPEDIISVEVFNQDRYSRKNIIIPPSG
ncbi:MAG TPA: hypothetical protein VE931_01965, partial [Pyrinomonadaceae bacterium]|nr:hypothetical protein [Pyrinomonadaceae bacterium]